MKRFISVVAILLVIGVQLIDDQRASRNLDAFASTLQHQGHIAEPMLVRASAQAVSWQNKNQVTTPKPTAGLVHLDGRWSFPMRMMAIQAETAQTVDDHLQVLAWGYLAGMDEAMVENVREEMRYLASQSLGYLDHHDARVADWARLGLCGWMEECGAGQGVTRLVGEDPDNVMVGVWLVSWRGAIGQDVGEGLYLINHGTRVSDAFDTLTPHMTLSQAMIEAIQKDPEGAILFDTIEPQYHASYLANSVANDTQPQPLEALLEACDDGLCVQGGQRMWEKAHDATTKRVGLRLWMDKCRDWSVCQAFAKANRMTMRELRKEIGISFEDETVRTASAVIPLQIVATSEDSVDAVVLVAPEQDPLQAQPPEQTQATGSDVP